MSLFGSYSLFGSHFVVCSAQLLSVHGCRTTGVGPPTSVHHLPDIAGPPCLDAVYEIYVDRYPYLQSDIFVDR